MPAVVFEHYIMSTFEVCTACIGFGDGVLQKLDLVANKVKQPSLLDANAKS